jgi:hypothetical protein
MVVELLTGEKEMRAFAELLRPEPTARFALASAAASDP